MEDLPLELIVKIHLLTDPKSFGHLLLVIDGLAEFVAQRPEYAENYRRAGTTTVKKFKWPDKITYDAVHGIKHGLYMKTRNHQLLIRCIYYMGRRHGAFIEHYANNVKKARGTFSHGVLIGRFEEWTPLGERLAKKHYDDDGELDGTYKLSYANGAHRMECTYVDGQRHGLCTKWFPEQQDGLPKYIYKMCNYLCGKKHGDLTINDDRGRLVAVVAYVEGLRHGPYRKYVGNTSYESYYFRGKKQN